MIKDAQARALMKELQGHGRLGVAAARAGMHRNTARRYVEAGKLPSEMKAPRTWRTRADPFAADWPEIAARLEAAPELEALALFEDLMRRQPGRYEEGQLRTFQRRVKQWRAEHGPPREIFFAQAHRPGEAMQTDFTWAADLGVTIAGEPFDHLLCNSVLPYSDWQSVTVCRSESLLALRVGIQTAVFKLGRVPEHHQTDNSTAATHDLRTGKRGFNEEYRELMEHLGMKPRTIGIGESHQNGDVEASNGALKRRLRQHLLLRGSRDFDSISAYEVWLEEVIGRANAPRAAKLAEELTVMQPLRAARLPQYRELRLRVSSEGTIRVQKNTYSVPSRLKGELVVVRLSEMDLEVFYGGRCQLQVPRLLGENRHRVDYRHIIWSLVKKPGAFPRYRYRDALFPTALFRRAYEELRAGLSEREADLHYLRILHLAAATMQCEVEAALALAFEAARVPRFEEVKSLLRVHEPALPAMAPLRVDLSGYDTLLAEVAR